MDARAEVSFAFKAVTSKKGLEGLYLAPNEMMSVISTSKLSTFLALPVSEVLAIA